MENYYAEAFKYLGTEYGWGGTDLGIDCSGLVCTVFRSFGIYLPRNTSDQLNLIFAKSGLKNEADTRLAIQNCIYPTAIYKPGHVMLYLGSKNGLTYVIHAPRAGEMVLVAGLSSLAEINGILTIK